MAGNPRRKRIKSLSNQSIPSIYGKKVIKALVKHGRRKEASLVGEFIVFLNNSLMAQASNLERDTKLAIVVGNNHLKISTDVLRKNTNAEIQINDDSYFQEASRFQIYRGNDIFDLLQSEYLKATTTKSRNKSTNGTFLEIENDRLVMDLATESGLIPFVLIKRPIQKTLRGNIRYESIILFQKKSIDDDLGGKISQIEVHSEEKDLIQTILLFDE